jgi:hypothetical protein
MMLRFGTLILNLALCLGLALPAQAGGISCNRALTLETSGLLDRINRENLNFLFEDQSFDSYYQSLSWNRKRKARNLVKNQDLLNLHSARAVESLSIELAVTLFGSRTTLNRFIFESKVQREKESAILLVKEQILRRGLLKIWSDDPSPKHMTVMQRVLDGFWRLQETLPMKLIRIPYILPIHRDNQLSPELLYKVIRDGYDTHEAEATKALKSQGKIEAYNTFTRLYSAVIFGTLLVTQAQFQIQQIKIIEEQQVQQTRKILQDAQSGLPNEVIALKNQEIEKAYSSALLEFRRRWLDDPTDAEKRIILNKIVQGVRLSGTE